MRALSMAASLVWIVNEASQNVRLISIKTKYVSPRLYSILHISPGKSGSYVCKGCVEGARSQVILFL